jgi:hypothetical protein
MNSYFNQKSPLILPVQEVLPGLYSLSHFKKDDRTQMCNLDRFIEATIPVGIKTAEHGLKDLFKAYHKASINGLKIELLDLEVQHVCTFVPTLSSVFFMTKSVTK